MRLLFFLLCAVVVHGQSESRPTFLAADVHPSAARRFPYASQPAVRNGLYEIRDASMVDLIAFAYGVRPVKVWGGPSWLELDRFDITAKLPEKATRETQNQMLQALLEDRFKLVARPDTKPVMAYALVVEKKGLLKHAEDDGETGCRMGQQNRPAPGSGPQSPPAFDYSCRGTTMQAFADFFVSIPRGQYMTDAPVVDKTGLEGAWDFDFKFTFRAMPGAGSSISIFDALSKIGLKLEPATVPLPVIAVGSVNEKPAPNPPETAKTLGPQPPLEFEVADIKPTDPQIRNRMFRNQPGGRVTMEGMSLKAIIQQAWDNLPDDMLADAPKWLDQDRWSMVAKAPEDVGRFLG